ncbi:MAG: Hint domain-containing protein [Pseudomonadota bacterium]
MVLRRFSVFDNDSLVVTQSPSSVLVGNGIINNSNTPVGTRFEYTLGEKRPITVDDNAGSSEVLEDNLPGGHVVVDGNGFVDDGANIEAESFHFVREVAPNGTLIGPEIKITVFSQGGDFTDVWGMGFDIPLRDGATYQKVRGSNNGSAPYADFAPCFGPGTQILCEGGARDVDVIAPGEQVWTRDNGIAPVRWVGRTEVSGAGALAPVAIAAGALGNDTRLLVSPQHRMLITGAVAESLFATDAVLVAAKHLCGMAGVARAPQRRITYTHVMFDSHQIVSANGCLSESFFLSDQSLAGVDRSARDELAALFPSLAAGIAGFGPMAAPPLRAPEAAVLRAHLA